MSFATAAARFAQQVARERAAVFAGPVDAQGHNLQLGNTKFTAAFQRNAIRRRMLDQGLDMECDAAISVPHSLGLTFSVSATITHLPTGEVYQIAEIGQISALSAETRLGLRRTNPAA